jgi:hypothetical protein
MELTARFVLFTAGTVTMAIESHYRAAPGAWFAVAMTLIVVACVPWRRF